MGVQAWRDSTAAADMQHTVVHTRKYWVLSMSGHTYLLGCWAVNGLGASCTILQASLFRV